jgi:hypothetical protein
MVYRVRLNTNQINPIVFAYIDSAEAYFPLLPDRPAYQALRRFGQLRPASRKRPRCGYLLIVHQPDIRKVMRLEVLLKKYRGVLHRLDIALDIQAANAAEMKHLIETRALLKWRRKGVMREVGETLYWARRQARRNLVFYADKPNRITGELDCSHLELRLKGADVIRKQKIASPKDLLVINPRALFAKHVGWSDFGDRYVKKIMRQETAKDRLNHRGKEVSRFMDDYRAHLPRYVKTLLYNNGLDRSQNLKNEGRVNMRREKRLEPPFVIPTILELR